MSTSISNPELIEVLINLSKQTSEISKLYTLLNKITNYVSSYNAVLKLMQIFVTASKT